MTDIAASSPPIAPRMPCVAILARCLLVVAAIGLWLTLLPALLARTGFVVQDHRCRLASEYRDPVTGRSVPAGRLVRATVPCLSPAH